MEDLADLLFQLASSDRLVLLSTLSSERLRVTQLAKKISATSQEASRHLARLSDAKLIAKDSEGIYGLTRFGELALAGLPFYGFVRKNREYFLSHNISSVPKDFQMRIGELSESTYQEGLSETISSIKNIVATAKEYLWFMTDQPMLRHLRLDLPDLNGNLRGILAGMRPEQHNHSSELGDKIELGFLDDSKLGLVVNEKTASVSFLDLSGRVDTSAAFSGGSDFHNWCQDLFSFHWKSCRKRRLGRS